MTISLTKKDKKWRTKLPKFLPPHLSTYIISTIYLPWWNVHAEAKAILHLCTRLSLSLCSQGYQFSFSKEMFPSAYKHCSHFPNFLKSLFWYHSKYCPIFILFLFFKKQQKPNLLKSLTYNIVFYSFSHILSWVHSIQFIPPTPFKLLLPKS